MMAIKMKVLDVSKYQPDINYATTAKAVDGVYHHKLENS